MKPIKQLELKLKLEHILAKDVKHIFNVIVQDFRLSVAINHMPNEASRYNAAWMAALDKHYRRVQKTFSGIAVLSKKQKDDDHKKELLLLALLAWREQMIPPHIDAITATTRANITEALRLASESFIQRGIIPSDRELAAAAGAILRRKFNGRVSSITITETQAAAESTKFTEAEVNSGIKPRVLGGGLSVTTTRKTWVTMGDSKVRKIHQAVNGQSQRLTDPFEVNGELLMYPGDSSLGASVGNVANCRCISQYVF